MKFQINFMPLLWLTILKQVMMLITPMNWNLNEVEYEWSTKIEDYSTINDGMILQFHARNVKTALMSMDFVKDKMQHPA